MSLLVSVSPPPQNTAQPHHRNHNPHPSTELVSCIAGILFGGTGKIGMLLVRLVMVLMEDGAINCWITAKNRIVAMLQPCNDVVD